MADLVRTALPPSLRTVWRNRDLLAALARVGTARRRSGPILDVVDPNPDLSRLPFTRSWPEDGGAFLTLPLVYTEHPDDGIPNLGVYRAQRHDKRTLGLHWQIGKGGGFHYAAAEAQNRPLPVAIHLGGPPAAMLAAIAPLPENVPELLLASFIVGRRVGQCPSPRGPLPLLAEAEFAFLGEARPAARRPEGPFGDHYGYYSLTHDFPYMEVHTVCHRRDPIFPATVVGKPRQEDVYIGDYLQELLRPVFPLVMPTIVDLWSYGETGYHALAAAVVRERYRREAMVSAFRVLGEGQLSLTKFLLVLDEPRDLRDFRGTLAHVLARASWETDLYVFPNLSADTLDYTGPRLNEGSKGVILALGPPRRRLPRTFEGPLPRVVGDARVFCPGCLVLEGPAAHGTGQDRSFARRVAREKAFEPWPLLVLVDNAARATASEIDFLWTTFTRFDPATDIVAAEEGLDGNHVVRRGPLVIDARLRPDFPAELFADEATRRRVDERWREYFPGGMAMGSSDWADLSPPAP